MPVERPYCPLSPLCLPIFFCSDGKKLAKNNFFLQKNRLFFYYFSSKLMIAFDSVFLLEIRKAAKNPKVEQNLQTCSELGVSRELGSKP